MANIFSKHRNKLREKSKKQKAALAQQAESVAVDHNEVVDQGSPSVEPAKKRGVSHQGLIQCEVLSLSHEGRGVAKNKGKTQFVHYALPNEVVLAEVLAHRAKYDELKAVDVLSSSEHRVEPDCPYFGRCGGCSLQHMSHAAQLSHKQSVLAEQLKHFGELKPEEWLPPVQSSSQGYRMRTRLSVDYGRSGEGLKIGYRKKNSKEILDIESCSVLDASLSQLLPQLKGLVASLSGHKVIGHIELLKSDSGPALLLRHLKPLQESDRSLLAKFAQNHGTSMFLQGKSGGSILKLWPEEDENFLSYTLNIDTGEIELSFHPKDFTQVNAGVNNEMVKLALKALELKPEERALDLFSGLGNFTLAMAEQALEVVGVEGSDDMVVRGRDNANRNQVNNASFHESDLYLNISDQAWAQATYDKILIDPPRAGALEIAQNIAHFGAKRLVYISCNPATLARDAGVLAQQGYHLKQAGVLDMFPHTEHVESIAVFDRM